MTYLWLVTFVTYNTRVSERMVIYNGKGDAPVVFSPEEQVLMLKKILEACQRHQIKVVACNILPDHVHMILIANDEKQVSEYAGKIKGYSAYAFQRERQQEKGHATWAREFHHKAIPDEEKFGLAMDYVMNNHLKHAERWGETLISTWESQLQPLVEAACISPEEALKYQPSEPRTALKDGVEA